MADIKNYALFRCEKRNMGIDMMRESKKAESLRLWAVKNTAHGKVSIIFEKCTGNVIYLVTGKKDSHPDVKTENLGNIEDYNLIIIEDNESEG